MRNVHRDARISSKLDSADSAYKSYPFSRFNVTFSPPRSAAILTRVVSATDDFGTCGREEGGEGEGGSEKRWLATVTFPAWHVPLFGALRDIRVVVRKIGIAASSLVSKRITDSWKKAKTSAPARNVDDRISFSWFSCDAKAKKDSGKIQTDYSSSSNARVTSDPPGRISMNPVVCFAPISWCTFTVSRNSSCCYFDDIIFDNTILTGYLRVTRDKLVIWVYKSRVFRHLVKIIPRTRWLRHSSREIDEKIWRDFHTAKVTTW